MPFTIKFDSNITQQQAAVIPDASEKNYGVMTPAQVAKLNSLTPGGGFPYKHYEHGVAVFDGTQDSVPVSFSVPFADALYEFGASLESNDAGVITCKVNGLADSGLSLTPAVRFVGRISWWAGATS